MTVSLNWHSCYSGYHQHQFLVSATLFYTIFLCDLFYFEEYIDVASYADDNTPYSTDSNVENTISRLESSSARLFNQFQQNPMKANLDKCCLLLSVNQNKLTNINRNAIHNSAPEKLLGISINTISKFDIQFTF